MKKFGLTFLVVASLVLSGCVTTAPRGSGQAVTQDAVVGGLIGYALTGDPSVAVLTGVAGVVIGDGMRRQMDERDQRRVIGVTQRGMVLPRGHHHEDQWDNGDYHYRSRIDPGVHYVERGRQCRPFTQITEIYDRRGRIIGTTTKQGIGCLDHRGNWIIRP